MRARDFIRVEGARAGDARLNLSIPLLVLGIIIDRCIRYGRGMLRDVYH